MAGIIRRSFSASPALLALMPYGLALAVWQGVTLAAYISRSSMSRAIALSDHLPPDGDRRSDHLWLLLALAFPAVFINLGQAHNGFLTAALIGGRFVILDRRPILAGILFGLLWPTSRNSACSFRWC